MKHPFTCCGYKTLTKKPPGTYEICSICFWEMTTFNIETFIMKVVPMRFH